MTTAKHTPTPVHIRYENGGTVIVDNNGLWVAEAFTNEFATDIVKCVNSHEKLVEALKDSRDALLKARNRLISIENKFNSSETVFDLNVEISAIEQALKESES